MAKPPIKDIQESVLLWYKKYGRHDLPWRNLDKYNVDKAYGVLVSEFMLQQTQVERVIPKFTAFIKYFPTIQKLADAIPAMVVTLWSGLGYNRRAILLHNAAKEIVKHFGGKIPEDTSTLQNLPGIGPYTAGAIAAFGYNLPVPVIDTNIERFFELLFFGYQKPKPKEMAEFALQFVPKEKSSEWHAALMDLMSQIRQKQSPKDQQKALIEILKLKPTWKLPKLGNEKLKRPKQSTFKHSPRYFRGKIVSYLGHQLNHASTLGQLEAFMIQENLPEDYSLLKLLEGLKKDKLIVFSLPLNNQSTIKLP